MVLYARLAVGVNVAVVPLYVMDPATEAPLGPVTVKVVERIVAGSIAMLKVALIVVFTLTFVVP
jgi:hypothetical protein